MTVEILTLRRWMTGPWQHMESHLSSYRSQDLIVSLTSWRIGKSCLTASNRSQTLPWINAPLKRKSYSLASLTHEIDLQRLCLPSGTSRSQKMRTSRKKRNKKTSTWSKVITKTQLTSPLSQALRARCHVRALKIVSLTRTPIRGLSHRQFAELKRELLPQQSVATLMNS